MNLASIAKDIAPRTFPGRPLARADEDLWEPASLLNHHTSMESLQLRSSLCRFFATAGKRAAITVRCRPRTLSPDPVCKYTTRQAFLKRSRHPELRRVLVERWSESGFQVPVWNKNP